MAGTMSPYPSTLGMLGHVIDDVWRELVNNRDGRVLDGTLTRDRVARRIIEGVMLGERDPTSLKERGMAEVATVQQSTDSLNGATTALIASCGKLPAP